MRQFKKQREAVDVKAPKELRDFVKKIIRWQKRIGVLKKSGCVWWDSPAYERKMTKSKKNYKRNNKVEAQS